MKPTIVALVVLAAAPSTWAGAQRAPAPESPIVLWADGAPGAIGRGPEDVPDLTPYLPSPERATGAAIVVCPGGSYARLAPHEGAAVAEWLQSIGIAAFVLKYRLGPRYHHPAPLLDAAGRFAPSARGRRAGSSIPPASA